ncbi:hypothetical protein SVAN01_04952 [Stagonosporopsis vannaccii]|nr:hypothetical protein SVAN01_04952 [Stagonosporopsis vannaccii]
MASEQLSTPAWELDQLGIQELNTIYRPLFDSELAAAPPSSSALDDRYRKLVDLQNKRNRSLLQRANDLYLQKEEAVATQRKLQDKIETLEKQAQERNGFLHHASELFMIKHPSEWKKAKEDFEKLSKKEDKPLEDARHLFVAIFERITAQWEEIKLLNEKLSGAIDLTREKGHAAEQSTPQSDQRPDISRLLPPGNESGLGAVSSVLRPQPGSTSTLPSDLDPKLVTAQAVRCLAWQMVELLTMACATPQANHAGSKKYTKEFLVWFQQFYRMLVVLKAVPSASPQGPFLAGDTNGIPNWLPKWLKEAKKNGLPPYWSDRAFFSETNRNNLGPTQKEFKVEAGLSEHADLETEMELLQAFGEMEKNDKSDMQQSRTVSQTWRALCKGPKEHMDTPLYD